MPKAKATCWAIRGQLHVGFRRLVSTMSLMSSLDGPLGPGFRLRLIQIFLQQFNESMIAGQNLGILMVEFSLFAFRRPRMKKHLTSLNDQINNGIRKTFEEIYANADLKNISLPTIGAGFYSLAQGLILQKIMNGNLITPKTSFDVLQLYLHAVLNNS
jgi:hypothetical protein